jgi:hypothetical protein
MRRLVYIISLSSETLVIIEIRLKQIDEVTGLYS